MHTINRTSTGRVTIMMTARGTLGQVMEITVHQANNRLSYSKAIHNEFVAFNQIYRV